MIPLLDRLRQDLPAEWATISQPVVFLRANPMCWYQDSRTVGVMIGDHALFVSFRQRGGWAGGLGRGVRRHTWADLITAIPAAAAEIAIDHACEGKPIPMVPPWATQALCVKQARRLNTLAHADAHVTAHLDRIRAERAILSTLTLGV
jgi:hypothetical protein